VALGLDPAAASDRLSDWWRSALQTQPPLELQLEVFYYAHLVSSPVEQGGGGVNYLDDEASAAAIAWAAQLGAYDEVPQGRLTQPVRIGVEWVARRFGLDNELVARFVARFFPRSRGTSLMVRREMPPSRSLQMRYQTEASDPVAHSGGLSSRMPIWAHPDALGDVFRSVAAAGHA
jgi:hypothetical protein